MWLRTFLTLAIVGVIAGLLSSAPIHGAVLQDSDLISGEWNVSFKVQGTTSPAVFKLKLAGNEVTGTAESAHTGPDTLRDGSWRNQQLNFTIDFARHESIAITGTMQDDKLSGEFRTEGFQSNWSATRKAEPAAPARVAELWATLWTAKQLDQLIELYAPEAVFLSGQGDRISGREAIRALCKTALEINNPNISVHSIATEQSSRSGL